MNPDTNLHINQYEDLYDEESQLIPYAEARYINIPGYTNPLITALPSTRSWEKVISDNTESPGLPTKDEFLKYHPETQIHLLGKLKNCRVCLPFYQNIETVINQTIIESYEKRTSRMDDKPSRDYIFKDETVKTCQRSIIKGMGNAPTGFSLIGKSGCGKTIGVKNALRKYPRIIIHNPGTMQQYIQIPILYIEMPVNTNFHGVYEAIGKRLDDYLGNNYVYEKEFTRKGDDLSRKFFKLCHIIENFNIGLLIIDEIEHISKNVKEDSLETFLSLTNETGIATGVIGTKEAFSQLFYKPRVARRMGQLINADNYCSSIKSISKVLIVLYSYLPYSIELNEECINTYYDESEGIISYILLIYYYVAINVATQLSKGKQPNITPKTIKRLAKEYLSNKKICDKNLQKYKFVEDEAYTDETIRMLMGSNKNDITEEKLQEIPQSTKPDYVDSIKAAIHAFTENKFTDKEIETAIINITKDKNYNNLSEIISATYAELKRKQENAEKRKKKKDQQEESLVDLKKFKESLPIANIDTL